MIDTREILGLASAGAELAAENFFGLDLDCWLFGLSLAIFASKIFKSLKMSV